MSVKTQQMTVAGYHIIAELHDCDVAKISFLPTVKSAMAKAVKCGSLTRLGENFHQFEPHGVTGIILLSESHLSVHTWPEKAYAAVDLFTCGSTANIEAAFDCLVREFDSKNVSKKAFHRGLDEKN